MIHIYFVIPRLKLFLILLCFILIQNVVGEIPSSNENSSSYDDRKLIFVTILARNKEIVLPYFLTLFSNLNYPKSRISLFIRSDHNIDRSGNIFKDWLAFNRNKYHSVNSLIKYDKSGYFDEEIPTHWSNSRIKHILSLKDESLQKAREMKADYIWFLDADVFIYEPDTLIYLIEKNKPIIGPQFQSVGEFTEYYYGDTDEYLKIFENDEKGCFVVPTVHSCLLVDLTFTNSEFLSHDSAKLKKFSVHMNDVIEFDESAKKLGLNMFVCNEKKFGFILPSLDDHDSLSTEYQHLIDIKIKALLDFAPLSISKELIKYTVPLPVKSKLHFDNIYLINLKRRTNRRQRMLRIFDELGIHVELFDAIDGKTLNSTFLKGIGVKQLHSYKCMFEERDMTYGEVGCFLSHYYIWEDIVKNGYKKVLIFEDDAKFEDSFRDKLSTLMSHIDDLRLSWNLIYLARGTLNSPNEPMVDGSERLITVDQSFWTLCYMITLEGAKKLLYPKPLRKMVPVDVYLSIMFNKHPLDSMKHKFRPRNLKAFSTVANLVSPTHFYADKGHVTDTAHARVIEKELLTDPDSEHIDFAIGPTPFSGLPLSSKIKIHRGEL